MVVFKKPVNIYVNNVLKYSGQISEKLKEMESIKKQKLDSNFDFTTYIDLKL